MPSPHQPLPPQHPPTSPPPPPPQPPSPFPGRTIPTTKAAFELALRVGTTGPFSSLGTVAANLTTIDLSPASPLTTYQIQVRSFLNPGPESSAYAGPATVTTPATPLSVSSANFRAANRQTPFSFNLTSSNPPLVTTYAITALPDGLTLNPTTGLISGTPTTSGKTTGQVTITHSDGRLATAALTIRVFVPPPALLPPTAAPPLPNLTLTNGTTPPPIPWPAFSPILTSPPPPASPPTSAQSISSSSPPAPPSPSPTSSAI